MSFVAPVWLFVFATAAIVLLLHARRRRSVAVASIQIWRLIEAGGARRPNLRRPPPSLALLLQLLALLLVGLALAQPRFGGPPDHHVVFLIDASGSMRTTDVAPTRFDAALAGLTAMVETLGSAGTTRISVIVASAQPSFAVARQVRAAGIAPLLDGMSPVGGTADWAAAARLANAVIREGERTRVVAMTDDASAPGVVMATLPNIKVEAVPFGMAVGNHTLTATATPVDAEAGTWKVAGTVHFFGEEAAPLEISVSFRLAGDEGYFDFGTIPVAPDAIERTPDDSHSAAVFEFELRLPRPGALVLGLPGDASPEDDAAYFVIDPTTRPQVLLIGAAEPDLVRALDVAGVDLMQSAALPADRGARFDLVIVNDVAVDQAPRTNTLWLQRGRTAAEPMPAALPDAYFTSWNSGHLLSGGVDWADVAAPRAFVLSGRPDADVIVAAGANPIIDARTTADGRDVRVALGIDASNWGDATSFPLFLANLVDWLELPNGPSQRCVVGVVCDTPAGFTLVGVSAPDFRPIEPRRTETFTPDVPGLYRFAGHGRTIEMAVNLDGTAESNLPEPPSGTGWSPPSAYWWRVFLAAAILVLAIELVLAGRGAERFFRRGALGGRDGAVRRRRLQLGLRCAALVALATALFPLPFPERVATEAAVAVDASTAGAATPTGEAGIVMADNPAILVRDLGDDNPSAVAALGSRTGIDLEGALRLAAAQLPADRAGTIIVAGNGIATTGTVDAALPQLQARDLAVDVLVTMTNAQGEALVASVEPPRALFAGDSFTLNAFIASASAGPATVTVFRDGEAVSSLTADLAVGSNRIEASFEAVDAGEHLFEVAVVKAGDETPDNNRSGALVTVRPAPRVMVVAPDADWGEVFATALRVQGFDATVVPPNRTPNRMAPWLEYDLVVLLNVPSIDLLTVQQGFLADFVEVHGRGLMILGGESAFGPGGYYRTDFERISPLSSRVPQDAPGAAIVFVLDRSGSMTAPVDDTNRLAIAKEATIAAVELLHPETEVGVTVFDSEAHRVLPLQLKNEAALREALDPLQPGGGTELYPGIEDAVQQLLASDAQAKHIVVLTDGLLGPRDFAPIIAEARAGGITISAVAIGSAADFQRASLIASLGGGAFHATQDFRALPSILSQEAMMLSRSPLEVRETPVFWMDRSAPFLAGLPDVLPPLDAYVLTSLQPGASLHLAAEDENGELVPILASWRYGNGNVVAFASHGAGPGSQRWLAMPDYALLWSQMARALVQPQPATGLSVDAVRHGDSVTLTVTALDPAGLPLNSETPLLELPESIAGTAFHAIGPGRYEATFSRPAAGQVDAVVRLGDASVPAPTWFGFPAVQDFTAADPEGLLRLAVATGGERVSAISATSEPRWALLPDWRPWIAIGLALFLVDLWVRYAAFGVFGRRAVRIAPQVPEQRFWRAPARPIDAP